MPSRKGTEQALTWLRSKMAERDTLDAVNAEIAYNVILDLKKKKSAIGARYHQAHEELNRQREENERLYAAATRLMGSSREDAI